MSAEKLADVGSGQFEHVVRLDGQINITKTSLAITAVSQQLVPANPLRRYLLWMVVGTQDVTIEPGAGPAVAGAGVVYGSAGAGKQGASQEYQDVVPTNAFQAIAAAVGSTVYVWEGQ